MRINLLALFLLACGGKTSEPIPESAPECERYESIDEECGSPGYLCFKSLGPAYCEAYNGPGGSPVYTYRVCCDH